MTHYEQAAAVFRVVEKATGVNETELRGVRGTAHVSRARHLCAFLLRSEGFSLSELGQALDRDHTTVLHSVRCVRDDLTLLDAATDLAWELEASR